MRHRARRIHQDPCPLVVCIPYGFHALDHVEDIRKMICSFSQFARDEICDLFRLGWIHAEVFANLFDILDGLLEINVAVVAYHRDDVGSVNFGLSIGVEADAVDLLDEVHVLLLRMRSFTLECWLPVIVESGLQPEYLDSMWSLMLRSEMEVRIDIKDG